MSAPRGTGRAAGFAFETAGAPAAPALLLLHGFLGSGRDWGAVAEALAPSFRCVVPDLPGHGATGDPRDPSLWGVEACADGLARLLGALGVARAAVMGYSLGGRIALHLAARHRALVPAAVVVSGSSGLVDAADRAERRADDERLARRLETEGVAAFVERWYRMPLFAPLRERPGFADVLARRRDNDPALLARALRTMGLGTQTSLRGELPRLPTPLLFLAGERDPKFAAIARDAAARCPAGEARVVPGAGHALVEEAPDAVAAAAASFLAAA